MGKQRNKKRITSKIDELPEQLRLQVDLMLADTSNTYVEISQFLKTAGYEISKSSICRYAARTNTAMQRLKEAQLPDRQAGESDQGESGGGLHRGRQS